MSIYTTRLSRPHVGIWTTQRHRQTDRHDIIMPIVDRIAC